MRISEEKEEHIIYIAAILLCLVLASFWLMSNIYARYTAQGSGGDSARVAIFGNDASININDFPDKWKPGTEYTYNITVTNQTNRKTSEVAQKYEMEIVTAGNLPLTYTLEKNGTKMDEFSESNQNKYTFKDDTMKFEAGTAREDTYQLKIKWPEDKNDASLSSIPDYAKININVEQID